MRTKKFKFLMCLVGAIASGCTTIKTDELTTDETMALNNKTIAIAHYQELPEFFAQTAINSQFGMVGVGTAIEFGNAMIRKNNIQDPAIEIAERLAGGLASKFNLKVLTNTGVKTPDNAEIEHMAIIYKKFDYVMDVRTLSWSSTFLRADFNNYAVYYSARVRFIDTKSPKLIASAECIHNPKYEDTNTAPTYAELENGTGLRKSLAESVNFCVNKILQDTKLYTRSNNQDEDQG